MHGIMDGEAILDAAMELSLGGEESHNVFEEIMLV
jgi:hypothetical protein